MNQQQLLQARGTREAVWAGTARKTSGGLTKDDLMMNPRGKLVSIKQSNAAKARYPELKAKLCASVAAAPVAVPPPVAVAAPPPVAVAAPLLQTLTPIEMIRGAVEAHLGYGPNTPNLKKEQKQHYSLVFLDIKNQVENRVERYHETLIEAVSRADYEMAISKYRR